MTHPATTPATETAFIGATPDGPVVAFSLGGFPSGRADITRPSTPQAARIWDDAMDAYDRAVQHAYDAERAACRRSKRAAAALRARRCAAANDHACGVLIYASYVRN